jgi:hypothetical protein
VAGVAVEDALEPWACSSREAKDRFRPLFTQERVAVSAGLFLDGLLGPERRKTGWMRAEAAGDPGPWRRRAILGRGRWEADALRDLVRDCAAETLADRDAALVLDGTGFLKQGEASCGVARQYTGSAGKIANRQTGVFAAHVSRHGHAFVDRALHLPKTWTDDPARLAAAHAPAPGRDRDGDAGRGRGASLGDRGRLRDRRDGARARPQRDPLLARLAPARLARDAGARHAGRDPASGEPGAAPENSGQGATARALIRWSVQELRRVATRLARRRLRPAQVIAWSLWRRAHQAAARQAHLGREAQL